ncbi:MAG: transcriptional repressor NrdR [Bdellovibrionaceae bacterium]|nr:transcriptional repressor NrdR [Bdellovibrionales bacterium]MCB9085788.1 transcriptional repressor NrdR [Pseudobdellovibrionaceae bacterium]
MNCPQCDHPESRVLDTRIQKEGDIRRRRECLQCKYRFTTSEAILSTYPMIVKKDGRREQFSKEKLQRGIQRACQKRPISLSQIEHVVDKIAKAVMEASDKEVPAEFVGQQVVRELRTLDHVAYVRFASVYRTFQDIQEFVDSLERETQAEV